MKSIFLRNFVATATLVMLSILIIGTATVGIGRGYVLEEYQEDMETCAEEVSRIASAVTQGDSVNSWAMSMYLSSISNSTGNQIFLSDLSGTIVSCSDRPAECQHLGHSLSEALLQQLRTGESLSQITDLDGMFPKDRYVVARRIDDRAGNAVGYVVVSNAIDNILGAWSTFLGITGLVMLGVFSIALIMSLIYSRRMAKPLDDMAAASRKFARGDFSVRVKQQEDPTDEMGALIDSFNKMADSLELAEARRSEFIANISHELRTPMTTISGFANGILDGTIPKQDEEKYLLAIRDETQRLSRLVRDMLDVSQMRARVSDPSRREVFDLTELVLQTMLSFESRATKKGLDVDPQFPEKHFMVRADKDAITQVIYNLMDNAVKFAFPDSCITVRLYREEEKALVSIKNRGETIPPDDLPLIFDRFHKSDRSRSMDKDGVGLGLYLVKTIINSHDEDIVVRSEDGVTEFVFTLPLVE